MDPISLYLNNITSGLSLPGVAKYRVSLYVIKQCVMALLVFSDMRIYFKFNYASTCFLQQRRGSQPNMTGKGKNNKNHF